MVAMVAKVAKKPSKANLLIFFYSSPILSFFITTFTITFVIKINSLWLTIPTRRKTGCFCSMLSL